MTNRKHQIKENIFNIYLVFYGLFYIFMLFCYSYMLLVFSDLGNIISKLLLIIMLLCLMFFQFGVDVILRQEIFKSAIELY